MTTPTMMAMRTRMASTSHGHQLLSSEPDDELLDAGVEVVVVDATVVEVVVVDVVVDVVEVDVEVVDVDDTVRFTEAPTFPPPHRTPTVYVPGGVVAGIV